MKTPVDALTYNVNFIENEKQTKNAKLKTIKIIKKYNYLLFTIAPNKRIH